MIPTSTPATTFPEWQHRFIATRSANVGYAKRGRVRVTAGLHYLRGNTLPYFSVTCDVLAPNGRDVGGGADHERIARLWPVLQPVIALHLCDSTGLPMHAEANGWYRLAGYYGGAGQQYHVGNSERHFDLPQDRRDPAKPWSNTEYRTPTREECLVIWAEHVRVPVEEARVLADGWKREAMERTMMHWSDVRGLMAAWLETQHARYQQEADAACALLDGLITQQAERQAVKA